MNILRRLSTARLLAIVAAVVACVIGVTAVAVAAGSSRSVPPPKQLANAIYDSKLGAHPAGVTGTITFTNRLFGGVPDAGALLGGGSGRLWAAPGGKVRLELQSPTGDSQIVSDGQHWFAYDPASNTVYRGQLMQAPQAKPQPGPPPSLDQINQRLGQLSQQANISQPVPASVAGQPSYTVRLAPKAANSQLSALEVSFAAANGVPLGGSVFAQNDPKPVLELMANDVSFGAVSQSVFNVTPPRSAHVVDVAAPPRPAAHTPPPPATSDPSQVQPQLNFGLDAPNQLAGLNRTAVRAADMGHRAVVTYGTGLGSLVVLESSATPQQAPAGPPSQLPLAPLQLNGATGQQLSTELGGVVTFQRGGVSYTVLGLLPKSVVETAARGL